jgi:hypothetical protein
MKLFLRFLLSAVGLIVGAAQVGAQTRTLTRAHAHNDYAHPRPLFDALAARFGSIEADVFLVDGKLLVAHERKALTPEKTLEALYLEPLRARIAANRGSVYGDGVGVTLLIDVKTEAATTYAVLHRVLAGYAEMVTRYENGEVKSGAISVIISGNRARAAMEQAALRYAAMDGRLGDLAAPLSAPSLIPLVSDTWAKLSSWRGDGPLPEADREKIKTRVQQAHAQGRRLRLWAAPDTPAAWEILDACGVDLINTDRLKELAAYLEKNAPRGERGAR